MTLPPETVTAAVQAAIAGVFPGETVYLDLAPQDAQRPCNLVELRGISLGAMETGAWGVTVQWTYKLTTFAAAEQVHDGHLPVLDLRAMLLLGAFAPGWVRAGGANRDGGRALRVEKLSADTSLYDAAEVTLVLSAEVDRAEFLPEELYALMQHLELQLNNEEEQT